MLSWNFHTKLVVPKSWFELRLKEFSLVWLIHHLKGVDWPKGSYSKWKKNSIDYERLFYFYEDSLEGKLYDLQLLWHTSFNPWGRGSSWPL